MSQMLKASSGQNNRVFSNFVALSFVQASNYLVPVIILPYLFRVLGDSRYGLIEFARAMSIYFLTITDYGFSLSATQQVAVHREDSRKVSEIFSAVMLLRFLLVILSLAVLVALVFSIPRLRIDWAVYLLAFGHVIGMWLLPSWLYQGMERMKLVAVVNIIARVLFIVSIFVFVAGPDDYLYVPLLQSLMSIATGLVTLAVAFRAFPIRFHIPPMAALQRELKNGWHLFLSRMATTLYTTSNTVILGLFTDPGFVGYYSGGDKIVRAVQGLQIPLQQATFPHIAKLTSQSKQAALTFASRVAWLVSIPSFAVSVGLFVAAPSIGRLALGERFAPGVPVIRILSFLPFIIGVAGFFGVQVIVNFRLNRAMTRVLAAAGFFNVVTALALVVPLRHIGVSIASLLTETFVAVGMLMVLRRNGIHVFRPKLEERRHEV